MNRKGLFETIALAVVTMMLVGVFSVLGTKFLVDLNQIVRRETVGLAGTRVSTSIYATNSVERADTQISFRYAYHIYPQEISGTRRVMIAYSYNDKTKTAEIKSPQWISHFATTSDLDSNDDSKRDYCIHKRPNYIRLDVGKCK